MRMRSTFLLALAVAQLPYARQAIDLAHTRDDALYAAFNRGYDLPAGDILDHAEIITEFRRAVLIVRERADQGQYAFGERDLEKAMAKHEGRITFIVQARLHPLHTYANTPAYGLYIETGPASTPIAPKPFSREPAFPPGMAGPGNPIAAVRLEGTFPRAEIAAAAAPALIVTDDQANVIWKWRIDLARYR
jgi:hypothetical protein